MSCNNLSSRTIVTAVLLLAACGSPSPENAPADAAQPESDRASTAPSTVDGAGFVNAFAFTSTGGVETTWQGDGLTMTGGCVPSEPMSIGFHSGLPTEPDYFNVAFDGAEKVGTGETGTFGIKEIRWDHGTVAKSVPGGMEVRVPNRFTGAGSISLTRHDASVGDRRMAGTVTGTATNGEGVAADVVVEFDINLSCGVSL